MVLALVGALLIGVAYAGWYRDKPFFASTLFTLLAVLTGFVCIVTIVAGQVKNRRQFQKKGLLGLAIAFAACIPQFWIGALGYGLGEMHLLSDLCLYGAGVSVILLVVTLVLILYRDYFIKPLTRLLAADLGLIPSVSIGAVFFGGVGFSAAFFGPMIFAPPSAEGPLLAIFITGPLGFVIGGIAGFEYWSFRSRKAQP